MRFGALATIQVGSSAISIVLAIVAALLGFEYWSLVIREVARSVLVAIGSWAFMPWVPSRPTRQAGVADMLSFGGNLTGFYIVHFLSASLGQVLIGRLFGADALGFYRQGQALVLAPVEQLSGPVTSVGDAALCRLQNNAEKYRRYYRKLLLLMSSATLPLVAVLAIFAEEFVHVLLGADWAEAAPIFRILAIAVLLSPSVTTTTTVTTTCGFTRRLFWLGVANSVVLVAFFFIGIPWGPTGIALAHVWAFYLLLAPRVYWSLRATPVDINLFLTTIARPVIAAAIMSAVVLALKCAQLTPGPVVTLALGLPVAAFVYSIAWLLMPGGTQTLKQVWQDLSGPLHLDRFLPKSVRTRASSDPI